MSDCLLKNRPHDAIPLQIIAESNFESWLGEQNDRLRNWVAANDFKAKPNSVCLVPDETGGLATVLVGFNDDLYEQVFG